MHTISYSATCWNSPAPTSLFNLDTDERSATVTRFSPGAEGAFEGRLLRFSAALDGAGERLTSSQVEELGARQMTWSVGSRAGTVPAPRAPRYTESLGPRDAAVAKGLQRTARHLRPDGLMSADSAILPSGFLRPLIPALEPPQRGRAAPRAPRGAAASSLG